MDGRIRLGDLLCIAVRLLWVVLRGGMTKLQSVEINELLTRESPLPVCIKGNLSDEKRGEAILCLWVTQALGCGPSSS